MRALHEFETMEDYKSYLEDAFVAAVGGDREKAMQKLESFKVILKEVSVMGQGLNLKSDSCVAGNFQSQALNIRFSFSPCCQ